MQLIHIIGAGGQAAEVADYLGGMSLEVGNNWVESDFFDAKDASLSNLDDSTLPHEVAVVAVGGPGLRKQLVKKWRGSFFTLVHTSAWISSTAILGKGVLVAPSAVIGTNVTASDFSLINIGATVSHDCTVGKYVTISPGANIGGRVKVGDGAFVGIGAVIIQDIAIGEGAVIGAGAVVTKNVPAFTTVVGNPGRIISTNKGWLHVV